MADIHFYFDPVCPFAWMTSKWVRTVQARRDYAVDWRFISLRVLNAEVDYATHFPPHYPAVHGTGLRLLRVAAAVRADHGSDAVGRFYAAVGEQNFETERVRDDAEVYARQSAPDTVAPLLEKIGLPRDLAAALDDDRHDAEITASTEEAIGLTGRDVGTPIIHFEPPTGVAFFGPVISRLPAPDDAVALWDHVVGLARFPGFAELKRSLRENPQLRAMGVEDPDGSDVREHDWQAGSRRT